MSEKVRTEEAALISDARRNKGRLPATVSKKRVLNVVHYPVAGGPHNRIARLAAPLATRGWETIALIPKETGKRFQRARLFHHRGQEMVRHRVLEQPLALAREVQKPADQKVVVEPLARQPIAAHRAQRHQQGNLLTSQLPLPPAPPLSLQILYNDDIRESLNIARRCWGGRTRHRIPATCGVNE